MVLQRALKRSMCFKMIFYTAENYIKGKIKNCPRPLAHANSRKCWEDMKQRCLNKKHKSYKSYGGRGVGVHGEWLSFEGFYSDMGERPEGMELDRIDNESGYCKENCQWISKAENLAKRPRIKRDKGNGRYLRGTRLRGGKYFSQITIDQTQYHIGIFPTMESAHVEYCRVFKEWYGVEYSPEKFKINRNF